jgi:hypothetical protein
MSRARAGQVRVPFRRQGSLAGDKEEMSMSWPDAFFWSVVAVCVTTYSIRKMK